MRHAPEPLVRAVNEGYRRARRFPASPAMRSPGHASATPASCPKRKARSSSRPGWNGSSALQMVACFRVFSGETVSGPEDPIRDTGLGQIGHRRDAGEEGRRMRSHRRKIASHVAARPINRNLPRTAPAHPRPRKPILRALAKASIVSGAPWPRAAMSALPWARAIPARLIRQWPCGLAHAAPSRPPCPPSRSPCRDGRSPPERPSGGAPGRPPCPTIRWRDRRDRPR